MNYDKPKDTTYNTVEFEVKGNTWSLTRARGRHNWIAVLKETNNPGKTLGRQFEDVEEACKHYKSPAMRVAIIQAAARA